MLLYIFHISFRHFFAAHEYIEKGGLVEGQKNSFDSLYDHDHRTDHGL